jgi:hypothetical protein
MPARFRLKVLVPLVLLAATGLTACGDSGGSGEASSPAARHDAADKIIAQAVGANPDARSGRIDGSIVLHIKGVPRFEGPIELTANGVYDLPDGASVPDLDIDVSVALRGGVLGGSIVVKDGTGYIKLGNTGYKLPDSVSRALVAPAKKAKNGLTKTGAMFYINPQDWQKDAELVGEEPIAGEPTQKITVAIRTDRAFLDLDRLVRFLALVHVPQAVGLPTKLGPAVRAALVRSVTLAKGEVWMGTDDHVMRQAHLVGKGVVSKRDQKLLYGATGATIDATLNMSEVGDPHPVSAPTRLDPYANLQLSLNALAEAIRKDVTSAKEQAK